MFDSNLGKKMSERPDSLEQRFNELKSRKLKLDMTRGKPCAAQLDLSNEMMTVLGSGSFLSADGTDCRNYGGLSGGGLDGLPEAKSLFSEFLDVASEEVIVGGNSSLNMMYDAVARAMLFGVPGGKCSWSSEAAKSGPIKFICPTPGYDRHFAICEVLGIEMISVPLTSSGPDMDQVERLVAEDSAIRGIWCVPKYANPTGAVYSSDVIDRLAQMKSSAPDFRIFYDNAYNVHHLYGAKPRLKNILEACKQAGNPNRVLLFGSTSKISFAGAGVAVMGGSVENMNHAKKFLAFQTIGPDKLNQLRHVAFFGDLAGIEAHMERHAAIIRPKFEAVLEVLERELGDTGVVSWSKPMGGYFISLDVVPNTAKQVVAMCNELGVKVTPAGATFPYGRDPLDRNIRIAPTIPSLEEIRIATEVLAVCVQLARTGLFVCS